MAALSKTTFKKRNATIYPDILILERNGLEALSQAVSSACPRLISVPRVFEVNDEALELEYIDSVQISNTHWRSLGEGLAQLHKINQFQYGWHEDNYIGLSVQKNAVAETWGDFFFDYRLAAQVSLVKTESLKIDWMRRLNSFRSDLVRFLDEHCAHPSLIHGDLWSGNVLFSREKEAEKVWLIDPAVYFGDREADLAMTELFGGFSPVFYQAYERVLSTTEAYPQKRVIYNFYHYLNHYNLFGEGYLGSCIESLSCIEQLFNARD